MARLTAEEIHLRYEALDGEAKNRENQLELLERFVMPGRGRFFTEAHDEEESIDWRHREIYDGTAYNAVNLLAANVHSALTSPSSNWFELRFRQDEMNDNREASVWLEECAERMRASIEDSNFSLMVNEFYLDGAGFGTAVMLHNEQDGPAVEWNGHRFASQMARMCYIEEDSDGRPVGIFIKRSYSAQQLVLRFGKDGVPGVVLDRLENPSSGATDKHFDVIHALYLDIDLMDADVSKVLPPNRRPYVGRYVLVEGREFLGPEDAYYELPGYVLRWSRTAGSKYGHCPGLIALGDILTLQEMVEMKRNATEKVVDPPLKTTRAGVIGDVEMFAGGLTQVRTMEAVEPLVPPNSYRVDVGMQDIDDLRMRIEQVFGIDKLQLKESPAMTATEVQVRYEMMQRLLGPTLGRIQSDFLDPLIQRVFAMMRRKGALEPPPQVVVDSGAELDIEYVGPLARAQKMSGLDSIQRLVGMIGEMAAVMPEMLDKIDPDKIVDESAKILGVPAELMRSEEDVKKIRDERKQNMQRQMAIEQAQGVGAAARDLSAAGMGGPAPMGPQGEAPPGEPLQ